MATQFVPPDRLLMGPGPSEMHPNTLNAMSYPPIGHLDPAFIDLMSEIKTLLKYTFQTDSPVTFPLSGPGTAGMEACFANLISPEDEVLICINGAFGNRMSEMAKRMRAKVTELTFQWGCPIDPSSLRNALEKNRRISLVAFVHAETSTGVLSNAQELAAIATEFDCLTIMDAVTSLGGCDVQVDNWGIDAVYTGSQKCLSCTAGLSPLTFSKNALTKIKNRKSPVQSWFMDIQEEMKYWTDGVKRYHHTAPINSLYALHESLRLLHDEGLTNSWRRHQENGIKLIVGLKSLGLEPFVDIDNRIPQLAVVYAPPEEKIIRKRLLLESHIEIGGGLGSLAGKVWRIGNMGHSSKSENIDRLLESLSLLL